MTYLTAQQKVWTGKGRGEKEGMTCSKEPQSGIEPDVAGARTNPLYMGHLLYQLSYRGTPIPKFLDWVFH